TFRAIVCDSRSIWYLAALSDGKDSTERPAHPRHGNTHHSPAIRSAPNRRGNWSADILVRECWISSGLADRNVRAPLRRERGALGNEYLFDVTGVGGNRDGARIVAARFVVAHRKATATRLCGGRGSGNRAARQLRLASANRSIRIRQQLRARPAR